MSKIFNAAHAQCILRMILIACWAVLSLPKTADAQNLAFEFSGDGSYTGSFPNVSISGKEDGSNVYKSYYQHFKISNTTSNSIGLSFSWTYLTLDSELTRDAAGMSLRVSSDYSRDRSETIINTGGAQNQSGRSSVTIPPSGNLDFYVNSDNRRGTAKLSLSFDPPTVLVSAVATEPVVSISKNVAATIQPIAGSGGNATLTYSVLPALPSGLSISSSTGSITGTPSDVSAPANYTVTVSDGSQSSTASFNLEVTSKVVASLDKRKRASTFTANAAITPYTPVLGGSGVATLAYAVSPALPSGLNISSSTGAISGTPTAMMSATTYTISVTDGITTATEQISIEVKAAALSGPIATPEVVTWKAGEASEVVFSIRSDYVYIENLTNPYLSLKASGGGPELRGTAGYPTTSEANIRQFGVLGIKFSWDNPIPGIYSGETYFYTDGLTGLMMESYKVPFTLIVTGEKSDQTISFTSTVPLAVAGGATYTPVATATSDLTVAFSINSVSSRICEISSGVVSFLDEGLCVINADQSGDSANNAAPQVQQVVEVAAGDIGAAAQTVSFTSSAPSLTLGGSDYTPTMTATSGLEVRLLGDPDSETVCWPVGNKVVLLSAGSCTVHAEQVGNFQYARAEASQTFTVAEAVTLLQTIRNQALSAGSLITPFTPVTGANGVGTLTYAISPTLSEGLSFSTTTGEITGTPTAPVAETTYTITVSDTNASSDSKTFTLTITDGPAAALAVASKGLTINTAASFTPVTGSGGTGPLSYTVSPALPATLSMSSATGLITGTPNATSSATNYTVTVTDQNSRTDTAIFALTVNGSVVATQAIATPHVTQGFAATAFTPVTGAGGTAALSYSVAPDLPAGLSMASATGQISGTATSSSSATTYTVTVTDANSATDTATFSLTVDGAVSATQAVATKALTKDAMITAFTPVTGAGGGAPLAYSVSPDLPTGLAMASGTGAITGTPTVTSSATTYTVTVTDANAATATATFSLTINDAVVATQAVATKTLSANVAATAFTPVTGTGGTGTLAYTVSPDLPDGLEMDEDSGEISGTATAGSSEATYTVTVTDDVMAADTETFSLSVDGPVAATTAIATTQLPVNSEVTAFTPVTGSGGTGALSYSVLPILPDGLSMASQTGAITGTPTTPTAAATYTVTVTDANSTTDTADFTLSVATISTSITMVASNTAPQPGETITLTASVTPSQATGSVTFKDGGTPLGSPVALVSGVATYSTADLSIGTHTLTAEYSGSLTYDGSTSSSVEVSLLSPSSEFTQTSSAVTNAVQDIGVSSLGSQAQTSMGALRAAIGRMGEGSNSGSNVALSTMSAPVTFHGQLNATDESLNVDTNFFGQHTTEGGAKRRLVFGTLVISKTDGGTTSAILNSRMAWEWSVSDNTMLGYWLGLDATRSKINSTFSGHQTSIGLSAGVYAVERLADGIFISGFTSTGQDKRFLEIGNTVLDLTSDFMTQNRMVGTALSASIKRGSVEWRPEFGLTFGQMDIGTVNFIGTAYGQTDDTLSTDMGNVSVANVSFTPEVIISSQDQTSSLTLSPHLDCQQVNASVTTTDCGGGASVAFEHTSPDGLTTYFAKIRSEAISGVAQTSVEVNLRQQF